VVTEIKANNNKNNDINNIFEWAKLYLSQGLSVIPLHFGTKEPIIPWKEFQERLPTEEELRKWFESGEWRNIAIVCGKISNNLVVLDFDSLELFEKFIESIPEELKEKLRKTWAVLTGKGVHVYVRVKNLDLLKTRRFEGIDVKGEGGYVVAPPSLHPSGKLYEFIKSPHEREITVLENDEFELILSIIKKITGHYEKEQTEFRELSDTEILKIADLLKPAYKKGNRELLVGLYLAAWCYRKRISKESVIKIAKILAENDQNEDREEKLKRIIRQIEYHYSKRYEEYLERTGKELKSRSGIQEILENTLGEQKALEILEQLQTILGASPFTDTVFGVIDLSKGLYYLSNPRKGWIVRAQKIENGEFRYKEIVAECAPISVVVYENPLTADRKYEIEFTGLVKKRVGPATLDEIVSWLRAVGVVKHRRLIEDALSTIISAFQRSGKAEIKEEIEKPGFYYLDGEIKAIKWEVEEYSTEQLKEALQLLDELRNIWYSHIGARFTTIIKWGIVAPFSYAIKQLKGTYKIHFPWIVLYGSARTGKSTLGKIVRAIWGLQPDELSGGHIETKARVAYVVSQTTFPQIVNEVSDVLNNPDVRERIKNAIEQLTLRGKYQGGQYREEPALSPLFMTTNGAIPLHDDAFVRRIIPILFTKTDRLSEDTIKKFESEILSRIEILKFIGFAIAKQLLQNPLLLKRDWHDLATHLLENLWKEVGVEPPKWIKELYEGESIEDATEYFDEEIRSALLDEINSLYSRYFGRESEIPESLKDKLDVEVRLCALLYNGYLSWAVAKSSEEMLITTSILQVLRKRDVQVESLKALADRFGWEYRKMKVNGTPKMVIHIKIEDFARFLTGYRDSESNNPPNPPKGNEGDGKQKKDERTGEDNTKDKEEIKLDDTDRLILDCYKIIAPSVADYEQPKAFIKLVQKKLGNSEEIKQKILKLIELGKLPDFYKQGLEDFWNGKEIPVNKDKNDGKKVEEPKEEFSDYSDGWIRVRALDYIHVEVNGQVIRAFPDQIIDIRKKDYLALDEEVRGFLIPVDDSEESDSEGDLL